MLLRSVAIGLLLALVAAAGCGKVVTVDAGGSSGGAGGSTGGTGGSATGSAGAPACTSPISSQLGGFYGPAPWEEPANLFSANCAYPPSRSEQASCVTVTAVDTWDETGMGAVGTVYVQDTVTPTPLFAGIDLVGSSFPPGHPVPGDVLDVTGTYEEYPGPMAAIFPECQTQPRLTGTGSFREGGAVPAPVVIQPVDLSTYAGARKYLDTLVTVQNVVIASDGVNGSGRYRAEVVVPGGSPWVIDNELFDLPKQYPLVMGESFTSVTGIVTYFEGVSLAPRSVADFQPAGADGG